MEQDIENKAAVAVRSSDWLAASGWTKFPVADRGRHEENWAKRFDTPTECNCNTGKRMQVVAYIWPEHGKGTGRGVELELSAELPCGKWVCFKSYSLREQELPEHAEIHCHMLLRAWEAAANEVAERRAQRDENKKGN